MDIEKLLDNKLNGAYPRMLRTALNAHWAQRVTNKKLYNNFPKTTETIRYRRVQFSGYI